MEDKSYVRRRQEISPTKQMSVGDEHLKRISGHSVTGSRRSTIALILLGLFSLVPLHNAGCAEPREDEHAPSVVVVFAGHTQSLHWNNNYEGVHSVSGIPEYKFNDTVACLFEAKSNNLVQYKVIPATLNIPFQSRPALAEMLGASALVAIHHDSAQPQILSKLAKAVAPNPMLDYYRGFSILTYPRTGSIDLAKSIESCMITAQIPCSRYHKEGIPGERMVLVKGTNATYVRRKLYVLRHSQVPAVIVECGCIANPTEEALLRQKQYKQRIVDAIAGGVEKFLKSSRGTLRERPVTPNTPCSRLDQ